MQLSSLIGKKTYQKHGFLQDGKRVPLTGVAVTGNFITQQIKNLEKSKKIPLSQEDLAAYFKALKEYLLYYN